ncbi:MAG: cbb3-type cytochrome oxidase assembly protein CcoS [Betaproteobacteria bacterium]|nr:cbb3-type cytochrome oxidase assembly protein CcoS [Betaproteobacteria bacterium]
MESLFILIPLGVALAFLIGGLFWWASGSGQFDDLKGNGERILLDEDRPPADPAGDRSKGIDPPV